MIHEHVLEGCTPSPLAHYLKALGILRLMAEQRDPQTAGCWKGEHFVLRTKLPIRELEQFFLEDYQPTPIVAPWNRGSGFYPRDNKTGIDAIAGTVAPRLISFRRVIEEIYSLVGGRQESPKDDEKVLFLNLVRSKLPEPALRWFDAAVMITAERPGYPPLLGTGGNDGRLDFTNNFMQRLVEIINPLDGKATKDAPRWLGGALHGKPITGLLSRAIGQFSPGNAGGPNASVGFGSESYVNPWDFVLMLEGALMFAGAATRRLFSSGVSSLSYPLTVKTTGAGSGCANTTDEAPSRAEIWVPLWASSIGLADANLLFAEGRVTLGRRPVRDGLDFARAVCSYGADRGIHAFQRFGFLMRSGKAYLATPLAKVTVRRDPNVDLLHQLDHLNWLDRLRFFGRTENASGRLRQLVHRLEDAIFSLTQFGGRRELQRILVLLGQLQRACAVSAKGRDAIPPMPLLGPGWATQANDQSHEFSIACALAGLSDMRRFCLPLKEEKKRTQWEADSPHAVWATGDLVSSLVRVLDRRLVEAERGRHANGQQVADKPLLGFPPAGFGALAAFLRGETDDFRIADLLLGLVNVQLPRKLPAMESNALELPPAEFMVLKPLFTPDSILRRVGLLRQEDHLPLPREIVTLLRTNHPAQMEQAMSRAWRRLRVSGLRLPVHPARPPASITSLGARLVAALMVPMAVDDFSRILGRLKP